MIGERIKLVRTSLPGKVSQSAFAEALGTTRPVIANAELDRVDPSGSLIKLICTTFNVNEAWLRTGEGEMFLKLSRNDEIAAYVAGIMKNEDAELQRFIVQLMSRIPPDCWSIIEQKARELADEKKKNQD